MARSAARSPFVLLGRPVTPPPLEPWVGIVLVVGAYLVGSFSLGLLLAQRAGVDLRAVGSGNIGATNVERALGKKSGLAVMASDLLKGALPVALARWLGADDAIVAATGVAATMGHVWPAYYGFRGGKGAATAGGVMLAAVPPAGAVALVTYFVVRKLTKLSSVGSLAGAAAGAGVAAYFATDWWLRAMAALLVLLVVVRHRDNIARLLSGKEKPPEERGGPSEPSGPSGPRAQTRESVKDAGEVDGSAGR
ncbi:MAG: glycerol-3-phosphate 1-O-acyltransferase PlsY [Deltaproteobacteria bacterium]|nr:glycerol-3-phosphate 1-O-acyltransferase PlsY [Deltaproteobacteria bacterium]